MPFTASIAYPPTITRTYPVRPRTSRTHTSISDPLGSSRATSVLQMYSIIGVGEPQFIFEVGKTETLTPVTYRFRNNTMSHVLKISFSTPSFMKSMDDILVSPLQQITFLGQFDINDAITKSVESTKVFASTFSWSVMPQNVNGPVFIQQNLPNLS